jgi:hypothetical protein
MATLHSWLATQNTEPELGSAILSQLEDWHKNKPTAPSASSLQELGP